MLSDDVLEIDRSEDDPEVKPNNSKKNKKSPRIVEVIEAVDAPQEIWTEGESQTEDNLPVDETEDEEISDDPTEILEAVVASDLSEDPVRLYLKEIGRIDLLDADSEFRLAARIEAERLVEHLIIQSGVSKSADHYYLSIFEQVIDTLYIAWNQLIVNAREIGLSEAPDIDLVLVEAQVLRKQWVVGARCNMGRLGTECF
jgi:RNA polymerase primary sigma factor